MPFGLLTAMVELLDRPDPAALDEALLEVMQRAIAELHARVTLTVNELGNILVGQDAQLLLAQYTRWATTRSWELINTAGPCGT